MRCIGCGAEMILLNVVPDTNMMVPGYEHHKLQCSGCYEVEQRLVFCQRNGSRPGEAAADGEVQRSENRLGEAAATGEATAPLPASPTAWGRAVEKVRNQQADLNERAEIAKARAEIDRFDRHWENVPRPGPGRTGLPVTDRDPGRAAILAPAPSTPRSHASAVVGNAAILARLEAAEEFDRVWENLLPHHDPACRPGAAFDADGGKDGQPPAREA